jgi:ABC-2 type transport system ATP-binding protein
MIEIRSLVKSFDGFRALDGLNLTVPDGAVYGLCGSNGAGKSTAIRHLAGILRQDSGEVLVGGKEVFENPELKGRIAYIPDEVFFYTQATIHDMMKLYRDVFPHFSKERFEKLGSAFEIDPKRLIRKLSKGMQKQAAFWLALSTTPDFLLLDEPVDGLDPLMRRQIWSVLLADVAERGTTVLVSSHNLRELEDVCDHVGIVDRGKMLLERSLSDLQENMVKIQAVFREGQAIPPELDVVHTSSTGRLQQLVIRGKADEVSRIIEETEPVYMDVIPLTLEEIFIYEMGGADHAIKNIIL